MPVIGSFYVDQFRSFVSTKPIFIFETRDGTAGSDPSITVPIYSQKNMTLIQVECPNCGLRNASEFRYGGEVNPRPPQPLAIGDAEWTDYIYMRRNACLLYTSRCV